MNHLLPILDPRSSMLVAGMPINFGWDATRMIQVGAIVLVVGTMLLMWGKK
jgi:hypothetical protein